ncbi:MAG: hypothetical protein WCD47_09755 [Candidatus Sulfotelmatobacter sp.]
MNALKLFVIAGVAAICFMVIAPKTQAQVVVNIGPAPECPYGYYNVPPYDCAPYGYYGPEWFTGGVFIGAGPWFHGPEGFRGHVNNHFHPDHGYHGPHPAHGDRPETGRTPGHVEHFKGNEVRDGRGHVVGKR